MIAIIKNGTIERVCSINVVNKFLSSIGISHIEKEPETIINCSDEISIAPYIQTDVPSSSSHLEQILLVGLELVEGKVQNRYETIPISFSEIQERVFKEFYSVAMKKKTVSEGETVGGQFVSKEFLKEIKEESQSFFEANPSETEFSFMLPNGQLKTVTETQVQQFYRNMATRKQNELKNYSQYKTRLEAVPECDENRQRIRASSVWVLGQTVQLYS